MNVILIPFFLAADVVVNDTSEWTFGPEYSYNLLTTDAMGRHHEPIGFVQLRSTVKCRPTASNSLLCRLCNSTYRSFESSGMEKIMTTQLFEIGFNEYGVESILIEPFTDDMARYKEGIVRDVATQFHVGVDLKSGEHSRKSNATFFVNENTQFGDCTIAYNISAARKKTNAEEDSRFVILPMADAGINTIWIEKFSRYCIPSQSSSKILQDSFFSIFEVTDRFEIITKIDGQINLESSTISYKIIQLDLDSIKPAQDELPSIVNGKKLDLYVNRDLSNKD